MRRARIIAALLHRWRHAWRHAWRRARPGPCASGKPGDPETLLRDVRAILDTEDVLRALHEIGYFIRPAGRALRSITAGPAFPAPLPVRGFFLAQDVTKDHNICKAPYHHFALSQRGKVLEART
jgi:hypothetical protein